MTGEITVTIYDPAFTSLGTITTAFSPRGSFLRNEAGDGRFTFPIYDTPARELVQRNRIAVVMVDWGGTETVVAAFHIHSIKPKLVRSKDFSGFVVEVSGPGLLYELIYDNLGYTTISDGSQGPTTNWFSQILAYAQNTWSPYIMGSLPSGVSAGAYLRTAGETVLDAILECIQQSGLSIAYAPQFAYSTSVADAAAQYRRRILFINSPSAGNALFPFQALTLVRGATTLANPNQASVLEIELIEDTHEVTTRVTAYGAGIGADVLTIADAQGLVTVPSGFSVDWANSVITNTTLEAETDQPVIHRLNQFGHIKSEDVTDDTANETAAIQLFWAAINYLRDRQVSRRIFYRVRFIGYPGDEYTVGQLVHLTYSESSPIDGTGAATPTDVIDVDDDFVVHELHLEVPNSGQYKGARVITMLLGEEIATGTFIRPLPKDEEIVVKKLKEHDEILRHATAAASPVAPTSGGGTYATADAQYLVLSTTTNLTNERRFVPGAGLAATDAGANNTYTVNVVAADTSMTINADSIQVRLAATSGLQVSTGLMVADSIAGAGLTIASKVLAVGGGDGIDVAADAISVDVTDLIGTGLVEEATNNIAVDFSVVAGQTDLHNRSHSIISSSDHTVTGAALDVVGLTGTNTLGILTPSSAPGANTIVRTNASGYVNLAGLGIGTLPSVPVHISSSSSEMFRFDENSSGANSFMSFFVGGTRRSYLQQRASGYELRLVAEYGALAFYTGSGGSSAARLGIDSAGDSTFAGSITIATSSNQNRRFLMTNSNVSGGSVFYDFNQTDRDAGSTGAFEMGFYRDANNITQVRMSKEIFEIIIRDGGTYYFPFEVRGNQVIMAELPTSDPGIIGALWRSGGDLRVSV